MKKNAIVAIAGTLVIAVFTFSGISFKPTSLKELKAKAFIGCYQKDKVDCLSSATGNIYVGYEAF